MLLTLTLVEEEVEDEVEEHQKIIVQMEISHQVNMMENVEHPLQREQMNHKP
jgi:hypothetical protein